MIDQARNTEILAAIRRWWKFVVGVAVVAVAASAIVSELQTKEYSASAGLLFRDPQFDQKLFGSSYTPPSQDEDRQAATNVKLVSLAIIAEKTSRTGVVAGRLTARQVERKIKVTADGSSDLVTVTATDDSPRFAAALANAFAVQYIQFRRGSDRATIQQARQLIVNQLAGMTLAERDSAQGRSLQTKSEELNILASLQTGNAELVQPPVVPEDPSSPRPLRNGFVALVLGLLFGTAFAAARERMDKRIRTADEAERLLSLPMLAAVPASKGIGAQDPSEQSTADSEAFRLLRARLAYFNVDREIKKLVVTSAESGDGKSTVAFNLARAEAFSGRSVVLVETDLRRPTLSRRLSSATGPGLVEYLTRSDVDLPAVITRVKDDPNGQGFDAIPAGSIPPNPSQILESKAMADLVDLLSSSYDFVIFDTPPITLVSDALPLFPMSDGTLLVVRLDKSSRPAVLRVRSELERVQTSLLGVVVNGTRGSGSYYYYAQST